MKHQLEDAQRAFTLVELLVAVAVAGILAGIGLVNLSQRWSQERLLLASRQLNSWLDEQRRYAMQQSGTCQIEINTTTASLNQASSLIQLGATGSTTNVCSGQAPLNLLASEQYGQGIKLSVNPAGSQSLRFSFRGLSETLMSDGSRPSSLEMRLSLADQQKQRCVRILNPLGLIHNGSASSASKACTYSSAR
jgi:prepilin-type N-terminal cleavage/methylation domain-containing protein